MIYFDNAATTYPKPRAVHERLTRCLVHLGGNPGRGAHRLSLAAAEEVYTCREAVAALVGAAAPEQIVFTGGATYALNIALWGLTHEGCHVLCSDIEHNAVMRPLYALRAAGRISFDHFRTVGLGENEILDGIRQKMRPNTALLVCTHASNICSMHLPVDKIGALCRARGVTFVVDAAQSAGHLPINMAAMQIDALALPAHKGLFGIQGCGVLALAPGILPRPLLQGGSGYDSRAQEMPPTLPERLETGTLPTPAISALLGGISFIGEIGVSEIKRRTEALFWAARERIEALPDYRVHDAAHAGPVLLLSHAARSATDLAHLLDRAGSCIGIDASATKDGQTPDRMQKVYIIPAPDGCIVATAHYFFEGAEGFGRRFSYMVNTLAVIARSK